VVLVATLPNTSMRVCKIILDFVKSLGPAGAPMAEAVRQREGPEEDVELLAALARTLDPQALPAEVAAP
jgi:hypothetical protein